MIPWPSPRRREGRQETAKRRFGVQAVGATGRSPLLIAMQHSLKAVLQTQDAKLCQKTSKAEICVWPLRASFTRTTHLPGESLIASGRSLSQRPFGARTFPE